MEHYRPKAGVTESPKHPGYWWLAGVWSNLLPSCPACNQRRRQTVFQPGVTPDQVLKALERQPRQTSGKANAFPLRKGSWVTEESEDLNTEDPLLINPCVRDPAQHIRYVFEWDPSHYVWDAEWVHAFVQPRSVGGINDPYADTSIAVYGLNRAGIFRERSARLKELQVLCRPVVDLAQDLMAPTAAANLPQIKKRLKRYHESLRATAKADQPYAGMAHAFLAVFDKELVRFRDDLKIGHPGAVLAAPSK